MKRIALFAIIAALACGETQAQERATVVDGVSADSLRMTRNGRYMTVDMALSLENLKVSSNRAVLLTPRLVNGNDSVSLPAVGVYGRRRYYTYVRNGESMLSGKGEQSYKASDRPDRIAYSANIDYMEWMDGSRLILDRQEYGCCNKMLAEEAGMLGEFTETRAFFPELVYMRPKAELIKSRSLEGSAYIDFPVDRTEIYPDYRRNTAELGKIHATIDSVKNDSDITITQVWLKGYASPESPYSHNRDLAIGRTASLKKHIQQLYRFGDGIIVTDYEPEDWAGLRRYVERSNISHRAEILSIIDGSAEPDTKEWKIKTAYPEEYRFLLQNCYPALRHTDYRIAYNIRDYNDVDEIKRVLKTQPQKLSLNEFYLVAQEYEPGTEEFTEVYETAVRMYPTDETANLNAANAALRRGDNVAAARYLEKSGDSAEALYARGALGIREGDIEGAKVWLQKAVAKGLKQAAETLKQLK